MAKDTPLEEDVKVKDIQIEEEMIGNYVSGRLTINFLCPGSWYLTTTRKDILMKVLEQINACSK